MVFSSGNWSLRMFTLYFALHGLNFDFFSILIQSKLVGSFQFNQSKWKASIKRTVHCGKFLLVSKGESYEFLAEPDFENYMLNLVSALEQLPKISLAELIIFYPFLK